MNDPVERAHEYLEFLAGRRPTPPAFGPDEADIPEAISALRPLRTAVPSSTFRTSLRQRVAPRVGRARGHQPARMGWTDWLVRLAVPGVFTAALFVVVILRPNWLGPKDVRVNFSPFVAHEAQAAVVTLTASNEDRLGVDPKTRFVLRAKEGSLTLADVQRQFKLTPAVDVKVKETGTNAFEIEPQAQLAPKTVYTATFEGVAKADDGTLQPRTYSWAYQVRDTFQIIGTLPRNQVTGVPANTGIEVTFSASGVSAKEFERHFSIEPKTDGRFEVHQRTLVFVPKQPLRERALYTVRLAAGLKPDGAESGLADQYVFRFEVAGPSQENVYQPYRLAPDNIFETVRPEQPIIFSTQFFPMREGGTAEQPNPYQYDFTVYRYPNRLAFIEALEAHAAANVPWAYYASQSVTYPTDGLTRVGSFRTKLEGGAIVLGDGFSAGYYIADSASNGARSQIPFAVSDLGTYAMTTQTDTLIWVNDLRTGVPSAQARITVRSIGASAEADGDGVARFTTPEASLKNDGPQTFALVDAGDLESVVVLGGSSNVGYRWYGGRAGYGGRSGNFWSFLTTDRSLYQPTDTLRFWGVVRRRDASRPQETVTVKLTQRSYEGRYTEEVLKTFTLTTTSTGTFLGYIDLIDVPTNGYPELQLSVDGQVVASTYPTIQTYRKAPYRVAVTPDRPAAINGERVTYTVTTSFFDGSPVPNVALRLENKTDATEPDLTTDGEGHATYSETVQSSNPEGLDYHYQAFVAFEPHEADVGGSTLVVVYPARFTIEADGQRDGAKGHVSGVVRNLHPERADLTADNQLAGVVGEPRPNQVLTGRLIAMLTKAIPEGTDYDFLSKQTVQRYRYETSEEERESFTLTTDARGAFERDFTLDPKVQYRIELTGTDESGKTTRRTVYLWSNDVVQSRYSQYAYTSSDPYTLTDGSAPERPASYRVGDQVRLTVTGTDDHPAKRYLFLTVQRGLRDAVIRDEPTLRTTFDATDVPVLYTRVVVFTGSAFREVVGPSLDFDETSRALTVEVTPDRATYGPGETATLRLRVTDGSGAGRRARVNVGMVDEALLALTPDSLASGSTLLSQLYSWVGDGIFGTYTSHEAFRNALAAEGGGGGGDGRTNFQDTALFTEVETDGDGQATASVKLPDNLTSWRVTAYAVTDDLSAGEARRSLVVQQALFVVPNIAERMLSRDHMVVSATAFGTALRAGDDVEMTFSLPDQPGTESLKRTKAFAAASFDLPELTAGDHRLRFAVAAKGQRDAVVETIHVVSSNLAQRTVTTAYLERGESPTFAPDGRTTLRLSDADRGLAYEQLWALLWSPYGRLDDTVAARLAARLLEDTFGDHPWIDIGDPTRFMTDTGLALYATGNDDLAAGALAASDAAFAADPGKLRDWFRSTVDDPKRNTEQVAQALLGLAELHEPVLPDVRAVLAAEGLTDRDRLTLALALEALGAWEEARPIARYLLDRYADRQGESLRLKLGESTDDQVVSTARFAILAAGLKLPERFDLLGYLATHRPAETSINLEVALALERLVANAPDGAVHVTYELNGQTESKDIAPQQPLVLSLDPTEAKSFRITAHTGNLAVVSSFSQPFDPAEVPTDPKLNVSRSYSVNGKSTTSFRRGDLVRVDLTWSKQSGAHGTNFGVVDVLPAGLRVVTNPEQFAAVDDRFNSPYDVNGQRVKFSAWRGSFYYYARAAVAGTSIAEPPSVQAFDVPQNLQYGKETVVTIQ